MKPDICPICGQDWLYHVLIVPLNKQPALVCGECEALWLSENRGNLSNCETYPGFMKRQGFRGTWDELEVISPTPDDFDPKVNRN